jgi:AAA+ superfamily predicted ATPase
MFDSNGEEQDLLLPPILQPILKQIMHSISSFSASSSSLYRMNKYEYDDDLWPTTFLLYGDHGTGKFSIAYTTTIMLGLNFYTVNAVNFVGDSSAYTEAKMKSISEKIKSISPCLVYIRNIHVCVFCNIYYI